MGNKQKLSKFREVEIQQYLEEGLFLLELIGINVFKESQQKRNAKCDTNLIPSVIKQSESQVEIRAKNEAIKFLNDNGIEIGKNSNYAKRQDNRPLFWLNPKTGVVDKDWILILNNQFENEMIVVEIPAGTFTMKTSDKQGFVPRHDRPDRIDLEICSNTLVDMRSKCNFGACKVTRIKY